MATEPNEVRRITLRRLQEDLAADDALAINLLDVLTRYIKQMRSRGPEMLRVESLPDIPLSVTWSNMEREVTPDNVERVYGEKEQVSEAIMNELRTIVSQKIAKAQKAASPFLVRKSKRYIKLYIASDSKREGMRWLLNVEGAFSLCSCPSELQEVLIRAIRLKKVMADKGKKSGMGTFAPNDKADYYFGITSITVNGKNAYELKGNFLDDLYNNAFSERNRKDAVEHIEYYLKIIDQIKLPDISDDESSEIEISGVIRKKPLCLAFNEFNYLLKVDPDLLTKDIMGFKTYEDYKNEWSENVPWVYDKPWLDNGIWKEPKPFKHTCKPFNYKTRCSE
ncbi:hypothetical protein Tco_1060791 [Tanacetum coccineum]